MYLSKGKAMAMVARNFSFHQYPLKDSKSIVCSRSLSPLHTKINQTADTLRLNSQGLCSRNEISYQHTNKFISQCNVFSSASDTDGQPQQQALNSPNKEGQYLGSIGHRKSAHDDTSSKDRRQSPEPQPNIPHHVVR